MDHITSSQRNQIYMCSLDESISTDHPVRFIDAFVEKLDLPQLKFVINSLKKEGRPSYDSRIFLKLYFYGYLNGIRSSRRLEKECERNIELHWLMSKLTPNYHSIADFRKDNPQALSNTFKLFVSFLKNAGMISGATIAVDGTKMRAHNSKKNNYSPSKIARHLKYIEEKTNEYMEALDQNDKNETLTKINNVAEKIAHLKKNKIKYEMLSASLEKSGSTQVSTTDPDSRALLVQGQVVEVSYNMQAAVDEKYKLVVATHTINRNDRNALYSISKEAKDNLQGDALTVLSDKGYHNGREIQKCKDAGISTICASSEIVNSNEKGTTPDYLVTKFVYNPSEDSYICPQGAVLKTQGTWHKKTRSRDSYQFKKYRTPQCNSCAVKNLCTGRAKGGREIERSEFAEAVEANNSRYKNNKDLYRKRQEWNEHIFGTIKRKWGYNHTNLIGLSKVNGEFALIMTVYNMKRCMNILGIEDLLKKIKKWVPNYKGITFSFLKTRPLERLQEIPFLHMQLAA